MTEQKIDYFAGIRAAALEIAYDNGLINRETSEEEFLGRCDSIIGADGVDLVDVIKMNDFLCSLTSKQLLDLCAGEQETEQGPILSLWAEKHPDGPDLNGFLNDLFEA